MLHSLQDFGFLGKLLIFAAALEAGLYGLLGLALIGVVLSIYYYFSWLRTAVMPATETDLEEAREPAVPTVGGKILITAATAGVLVLGLYQGGLTNLL